MPTRQPIQRPRCRGDQRRVIAPGLSVGSTRARGVVEWATPGMSECPIFATMIILGSWWASIAWSRYWGWDPKETSALVTWLTYAIYLHARNQRRWAGRPAALLLVVGFGMVLVTYSGSLWFNGLHAYSGL